MTRPRLVWILAIVTAVCTTALGADSAAPVVVEIESFQLTHPATLATGYGEKCVLMGGGDGHARATGTVTLDRDAGGFWVHVYFDAPHAVAGDANSVFVTVDDGRRLTLEGPKDRWLWRRVNVPLKAGRHTVRFERREAPVYLDCLVVCDGPDAEQFLDRIRPPRPIALPFGLKNDFFAHDAPTFGEWNAFGTHAAAPAIGLPQRPPGVGRPLLRVSGRGTVVLMRKQALRLPSHYNWLDRPTCVIVRLRTKASLHVSALLADARANALLQPMTAVGTDDGARIFITWIGWSKDARRTGTPALAPPLAFNGLVLDPGAQEPFEAVVDDAQLTAPVRLAAVGDWRAPGQVVQTTVRLTNTLAVPLNVPLRLIHCGPRDGYAAANNITAGSSRSVEVPAGRTRDEQVELPIQGDGFYGAALGLGTPVGCTVADGRSAPWTPGPPDRPALTLLSHFPTGFGVPSPVPFVRGNYLYLPGGEGDMTVLDTTDKRRPVIASITHTWHFWHRIWPFRGRLFFKPSRAGNLFFFDDGADPWHPGPVRASTMVGPLFWMDEKLAVAVTQTQQGLTVWDLRNLYEPRPKSELKGIFEFHKLPGKPLAVGATAGRRELALLAIEPDGRLRVVHKFNNEFDKAGKPAAVACVTPRLLLLRRDDRLVAYDLADPRKPVRRFDGPLALDAPTCVRAMVAEGDTLYVSDARYEASGHWVNYGAAPSALYAFDLRPIYTARPVPVPAGAGKPVSSDELKPPTLDEPRDDAAAFEREVKADDYLKTLPRLWRFVESTPTYYGAVTVQDGYLYVSDYDYGIHIFKLNGRKAPTRLGGHITAGEGHFGALLGNVYCLAQTFGGSVTVIDVSDPLHPKRRGVFWDGEFVWAKMAGRGTALYLPKYVGRVKIVDIADPDSPREVGLFDVPGKPRTSARVVVLGTRAFVITGTEIDGVAATRILEYDVTQPLQPRLRHTLALSGPVRTFNPQIVARAGAVYVMDALHNRLYTVSVARDGAMKLEGTLEDVFVCNSYNMEYPGAFTVARGYAYVPGFEKLPAPDAAGRVDAALPRRFHIIDVRDLAHPRLVRTFNPRARVVSWANFICDMESTDDFLVAGNYGKLLVYDIRRDPTQPVYLGGTGTAYNWTIGVIRDRTIYSCGLNGLYIIRVWP